MRLQVVFLTAVILLLCFVDSTLSVTWTNDYPGDDSWCTPGNWAGGMVPGPLDAAEILCPPERGPVIDCNVDVGTIDGPNPPWGCVQVMDITDGTVAAGMWLWYSGTGTAVININGTPEISIGGTWRGPDDGTGILNISGDPNVTVEGDLRGADASGQFVMNMSGGRVRCGRFKIGDDGGGELNVSEGHIDVMGEMRLGTRAFADIAVNMTGGSINVGGPITANPDGPGAVSMNLREGTMRCGALTHGTAFQVDIEQGVLVIEGDVRVDIEADIAAGNVTAYEGRGTVAVDFNNTNPGCTTVSAIPRVIYVDGDANGANDGSSWEDAFNYLQDALAIAGNGDEIRVAEGVYKPDEDGAHPNGTGDRTATFQLINGVAVRGGYAGCDANDPNARDFKLYETILSGDLNDDDSVAIDREQPWDDPTRDDNSYHVVTSTGTDATAMLDGFTITSGNAIGGAHDFGGGIYNDGGRPVVSNCTISKNVGLIGGGMENYFGSPTLTNCTFDENWSTVGGGMNNYPGSPVLTNCTFTKNWAYFNDGGMSNSFGNPELTNCVFTGNWGWFGGGGMGNYNGSPILTNCTFAGNLVEASGGSGLVNAGNTGVLTLTNCILWGNEAAYGPISDEAEQIYGGTIVVNYCCIQGWTGALGGTGNIGVDPCFVEVGDWDENGTPGYFFDDFWVGGDCHLSADSLCIDVGDNNGVGADTSDLDGDGNTAEPIPWDLDGNPRIADGNGDGNSVVDMGAYERYVPPIEVAMKFTPQALNPGSKGKLVKAHFVLPEGYAISDVDANSPAKITEPFEPDIDSNYVDVFINDDNLVEVEAAFERSVFCEADIGDEAIEVTVVGSFMSGQQFYGTDTIKVTTNYFKHLGVLASYWLEQECDKPDWCEGADLDQDSVVDFVDLALFDGCCIEVVGE